MDRRPPLPTLRGPRVTLRPAVPGDAPAVLRVLRAPEVARWWPIDDDAEALALCDGSDPDIDVWVIDVAGAGEGVIQTWEETDPQYRHAGIDLALHPSVQGRRLGPEAIRLVARYLLDERGHHRLTIDPNRANARAIAAYRSVGFREVGVLRSVEWDATLGRWTDGLLMDLLAGELTPDEPTPDVALGDQIR
ncbi:MAG: GNAT family protein [Chloroflexota bacterium]